MHIDLLSRHQTRHALNNARPLEPLANQCRQSDLKQGRICHVTLSTRCHHAAHDNDIDFARDVCVCVFPPAVDWQLVLSSLLLAHDLRPVNKQLLVVLAEAKQHVEGGCLPLRLSCMID